MHHEAARHAPLGPFAKVDSHLLKLYGSAVLKAHKRDIPSVRS
jgi:hypothetical protein